MKTGSQTRSLTVCPTTNSSNFFCAKFSGRDNLKAKYKEREKKRIESELARVARLRNHFCSNSHPDVSSPGSNSQFDAEFGYAVSTITLSKSLLLGSYNKFSMEKYALHDVFGGGDNNPLKRPPKPSTLSYFHFPANNMIWICNLHAIFHWETDKNRNKMATLTREITYELERKSPDNKQKLHDNLCKWSSDFLNSADLPIYQPKKGIVRLKVSAIPLGDTYDYLYHDPPLHSRRTLDQSYYWKLNDTGLRDRDQVVYRATRTGNDTKKTTRVIMVNQLWLYILDDHTILTSFPKRCGRKKPGQKTDAFERFWGHLKNVNLADPQKKDIRGAAGKYLNINPEGVLLREAHDIMDKLKMMRSIYEQLAVVKDFARHLLEIHEEQHPQTTTQDLLDGFKKLIASMPSLRGTAAAGHDEAKLRNGKVTENGNHIGNGTGTSFGLASSGHDDPTNGEDSNINAKESLAAFGEVPKATVRHANLLVEVVDMRRQDIQHPENTIKDVSDRLRDFLSLKQQQASVLEA
ncbi:hypothetical protein B0O99DRAFT_587613 [Bisporella sp. PMI_857]|nr:hypothetical protein B0O99DRAFT_587613 [Bisporella sp. PMI_857]